MSAWEKLIEFYNHNIDDVCPVAHTYITAHIAVLLDINGKFLFAMDVSNRKELVAVPCTIESSSRTRNVAPHLINDNLSYLGNLPEFRERYVEYIMQLKAYVDRAGDLYAKTVYKYISKGKIMSDLDLIIKKTGKSKTVDKLNVIFAIYSTTANGSSLRWADYYYNNVLLKNGICQITGEPDHIPKTYPGGILSPNSQAKLFMSGCGVGYIASQKIIHALQYLIYAKENQQKVKILDFETELKANGFTDKKIKEIEKYLIKSDLEKY